jgi:hypothetical protein
MFQSMTLDSLFETDINEEITSIIESISFDNLDLFECILESNNVSLLNESSITDGFVLIITKLIDYIKSMYDKFISIIMALVKPADAYIQKYRDKLVNIKEDDISDIVYEYKTFNIQKDIPKIEYIKDVDKYIQKMNDGGITHNALAEFRSTVDDRISIVRERMLGLSKPIPENNFDSAVKRVFRPSTEIFTKHLTKADLIKMIDGIDSYDEIKKDTDKTRLAIINLYTDYRKLIGKIYSLDYSSTDHDVIIKTDSGNVLYLTLMQANMYKDYQSLVSHFIVEVATSYTSVFKEKLLAIKEKFEMEYAIIKQVVYLIS